MPRWWKPLAREAGQPARRFLGVVFGDDFMPLTSALCLLPAQFDRYRDLFAQPGAGRQPGTGLATASLRISASRWMAAVHHGPFDRMAAPEYPNEPTAMTVWPANPRRMSPRDLCDLAIQEIQSAGGSLLARPTATAFASDGGLRGQHLQLIAENPGTAAVTFAA